MEPFEEVRTFLLDSIGAVHVRMEAEFTPELGLSNVYIQGSLINQVGQGFSSDRSDVDFLIVTSHTDARRRTQFVIAMKRWMQEFENRLRRDLPHRQSFPIIGACIATEFEIDEGIHKNRNTTRPYDRKIFLRLSNKPTQEDIAEEREPIILSNRPLEAVGNNRLKRELTDSLFFPAWAVMAKAQSFRSHFASPKNEPETDELFDNQYLALPKDLLRNAYISRCFAYSQEVAIELEDDIAKGRNEICRLLEEVAPYDTEAKILLSLIETNGPGGKGDRQRIKAEQLLYLWELLSSKTAEAITNLLDGSSINELKFADDSVIKEFIEIKATALKVVDKAILIYRVEPPLWDKTIKVRIHPHQEINTYKFDALTKSLQINLASEWNDDIEKYLRSRDTKTTGFYDCKVGFHGLLHNQVGAGYEPEIIIRPLTHWVTEQFNREMIAQPNDLVLQKLRKNYAKKLFKPTADYLCECPSNLYVEVVIITSDYYIPKLWKNPADSPQGRGTGKPVLTCGIEYGFFWERHVDEKGEQLKIEQALMDGLKQELRLEPSHIAEWSISSLAVQHAHLNTALLGVVRLNITKGDLTNLIDKHLDKNNSPFKKADFLSMQEAQQAVATDKNTGKWHQTALMRIALIDFNRDMN
jgi:hypothetical protein